MAATATEQTRDWRDWSREQLHRIGLFGSLNAVNLSQAATRNRLRSLGSDSEDNPEPRDDEEMTPDELRHLTDLAAYLPIGSHVTINQHGAQESVFERERSSEPAQPVESPPQPVQDDAARPQEPAKDSLGGRLAKAGVLALAAGGLGYGANAILNRPPAERVVPAVLEWEVVTDDANYQRSIERRIESQQRSDRSASQSGE